jgi:hypothetical protein
MAASDKNSDAAIRARFSGSVTLIPSGNNRVLTSSCTANPLIALKLGREKQMRRRDPIAEVKVSCRGDSTGVSSAMIGNWYTACFITDGKSGCHRWKIRLSQMENQGVTDEKSGCHRGEIRVSQMENQVVTDGKSGCQAMVGRCVILDVTAGLLDNVTIF